MRDCRRSAAMFDLYGAPETAKRKFRSDFPEMDCILLSFYRFVAVLCIPLLQLSLVHNFTLSVYCSATVQTGME